MTEKINIKLGHQAPTGYRKNECHHINIKGDLHYCHSHDFVYNSHEEERKGKHPDHHGEGVLHRRQNERDH